jgi:oligoribonuclease NrnB/cAMP/cGMP phosphodiesterase (DHH superfamily)
VYILDFAFEEPGQMEELLRTAKRLVALDHHISSKALTESAPEHVFDNDRSGATIAWSYFHPETPVPQLLRYIEDNDIYRYALPETQDIATYLIVQPYEFAAWEAMVNEFEDEASRPAFLAKARAYNEFYEKLCALAVKAAKKVRFEDYECYFANSLPSITMRSHIGHLLYTKLPPLALVVSAHPDGYGVSIRSDGSVDVAKLAEKYGGGGHAGSAGFFVAHGHDLPWTEVEEA